MRPNTRGIATAMPRERISLLVGVRATGIEAGGLLELECLARGCLASGLKLLGLERPWNWRKPWRDGGGSLFNGLEKEMALNGCAGRRFITCKGGREGLNLIAGDVRSEAYAEAAMIRELRRKLVR